MTEHKGHQPRDPAGRQSPKKNYAKPAFEFERVFETMALSCGKMQATQGQCHYVRKSS